MGVEHDVTVCKIYLTVFEQVHRAHTQELASYPTNEEHTPWASPVCVLFVSAVTLSIVLTTLSPPHLTSRQLFIASRGLTMLKSRWMRRRTRRCRRRWTRSSCSPRSVRWCGRTWRRGCGRCCRARTGSPSTSWWCFGWATAGPCATCATPRERRPARSVGTPVHCCSYTALSCRVCIPGAPLPDHRCLIPTSLSPLTLSSSPSTLSHSLSPLSLCPL